ncbi:MAG: phosphodiester glycosidase family protein [Myxococcaceae bacterium]|nr:phosphodiester glycosidase family protein [Myxococcaceae bacterium]
MVSTALTLLAASTFAQVTHPFPGVTLVQSGGSAMAVADLCADGVSMRATRYGERRGTPRTWATRADVNAQVAINADFFDFPGWTYVIGRARGAGESWPADKQLKELRSYWQFGPRLAELVTNAGVEPKPGATEIVGGHNILILNGVSRAPNFDGDAVITTAHRRTAVGVSADKRFVYLYASNNNFNGSQVVAQLVSMAAAAGAPPIDMATNMDGGGSSQMYVGGLGQVIDSGREVNNHLGIIARGTGAPTMCPYPPALRDVVLRPDRTSGWTMDAHGAIAAFGGAPALGPAGDRWNWDIARALALRPDGVSAYLMDGWGGIHPVGNAPAVSGFAYWPNWDIARALALRADGKSGYTLDGYGGVHPFGGAPAVTGFAYWPNWDIARDLVLRSDGKSGYTLDGYGGIHPFGGAPPVTGYKYFGVDVARGITLSFDDQSGYVVDQGGGVWAFGKAPPVAAQGFGDTRVTALALGNDGVSGVVLHAQQGVRPFRAGRPARKLVLLPGSATDGYRLRGDGELESIGAAPSLGVGTGWPNWDIARDVVLRADGKSGWILEGWGGVHQFGGASAASGYAYWPNWDIARALVARPDGTLGYSLDGYGGLHGMNSAPALTISGYTPNLDLARDLVLTSDGLGGYSLSGKGALNPLGNAPAVTGAPSFAGDLARAVALRDDTSGYVLDGAGGVHAFGGAPGAVLAAGASFPGWDVFRDVALTDGGGVTLDVYGGLHPWRAKVPGAPDAGQSETDAGMEEPPVMTDDAGTQEPPAGTDAGEELGPPKEPPVTTDPTTPARGCGCALDGGLGPAAFLLLSALLRRRRGSRR